MQPLRRILPAILIALAILAVWELYCAWADRHIHLRQATSRGRSTRARGDFGHAASTLSVAALVSPHRWRSPSRSPSRCTSFRRWAGQCRSSSVSRAARARSADDPVVRLRPAAEMLLVILVTFFPMLVACCRATPPGPSRPAGSMGAGKATLFSAASGGAGRLLRRPQDLGHLRHRRHHLCEYAGARRAWHLLSRQNSFAPISCWRGVDDADAFSFAVRLVERSPTAGEAIMLH